MRYLSSACPDTKHVLLVESGSRSVMEAAIPRLRHVFGAETVLDLVTCYPGLPAGLPENSLVWRTQDHTTPQDRARLAREIEAAGAKVVAMVCSGEQIMTRWKWWLAWKLPAKVLIVNENGDFFWFDAAHLGFIRRFVVTRMGVPGEGSGAALMRLALFPFVLAYLLLYATVVHARRALRLIFTPRPHP